MDVGGSAYAAASVAYTYDAVYQLTTEARTGGNAYTNFYWYDNSGNRTKMNANGTNTNYSYDYIDRLTLAGATQYQWDTWGNLTQSGVAYNYYWDDADRLTKFDGAGTQYDTTYNYEPGSWQRVKANKNGAVTYFAWDRNDLEAEYDGSGNLTRGYVTPGVDDHLSMLTGGSTYYYFQDGLGSVRNVVDSSQTVQDTYDYDAWGNDIGNTTPVNNPMQYTGAYRDSYNGPMYYLRNRYFSPAVGLFAARDAFRADEARGWGYTAGDPLSYRDPFGLDWLDCMNNCMEINDPLSDSNLGHAMALLTCPCRYRWLKALGLPSLGPKLGKFTNLASYLSGLFGLGKANVIRGLASVLSRYSLAYGVGLGGIEVMCASTCAYDDSYWDR